MITKLVNLSRKRKWLLFLFVLSIVTTILIDSMILYIAYFIGLILLLINIIVYKKTTYNAINLFSTIGRNYQYLIIGELCDISALIPKGANHIDFLAPRRSSYSCLELTKRLYSLLDEENGELLIIVTKKGENSRKVSIFDIPYLHEITLKRLHISWMRNIRFLPLFFSPFSAFSYYFPLKKVEFIDAVCPWRELSAFCESRNIRLVYKQIRKS